MAYVLGFFAADGSMLLNSRGGSFIEFQITDRSVLEQIQRVTGSNHTISTRTQKTGHKTLYRLQIGSKEWYADLLSLGFTQAKSLTLSFPKVPRKYLAHFVRGYFDGDGCVYLSRLWSRQKNTEIWVFSSLFTSGSREFLTDLHKTLLTQGIVGGHISKKQKGGYALVLSRHDSLALYRFMYHTAPTSDLYLPRKREKLERAIQVLGLE